MNAKFQVISLFPKMIEGMFQEGVVAGARKKGLIEIDVINPRAYTQDTHQTVDDRPFGGGDGMVGLAEPLWQAWSEAQSRDPETRLVYLSPQGETLSDALVRELATAPRLTLLCGRYGGVDQRFLIESGAREISIGDYVLSGGEFAAGVLIDAVARQLPGVLGHADSAQKESFAEDVLEAPQFTRPREWRGHQVPEALMSGHHVKIDEWKSFVAILVTLAKRPDLEPLRDLSEKKRRQLLQFFEALSAEEKKLLGIQKLASETIAG